MEITLTNENFEEEVLNSDVPVLVDFWAVWCGPCRMLSPVVDQVAEENPDIKVCKVNVDEANEANGAYKVGKVNVDEAPELAARYRIAGIPAIVVFKNGEVYKKSIGVVPKADLEELLK